MNGPLGQIQSHRVLLPALVELFDHLGVAGLLTRTCCRVWPLYRVVDSESHTRRRAAGVLLSFFGIFPFGLGFFAPIFD